MKSGDTLVVVEIDDKEIDFFSDGISFSFSSNIYKLFNTGTVTITDSTGLMLESLMLEKGSKFKITYGLESIGVLNISDFVIEKCSLAQSTSSDFLAGSVDLTLFSPWFINQSQKSISFHDRISNIVNIKTNIFGPKKYISDTGNLDYWYQSLEVDVQFLRRLVKFAWSENASGTPFTMFINNAGFFNFCHMRHMLDQTPIKELYWKNSSIGKQSDQYDDKRIAFIRKLDDGLSHSFKYFNFKQFSIDENGELIIDSQFNIKDPSGYKNKNIAVLGTNIDYSDRISTFDLFKRKEQEENRKGFAINETLHSFLVDKYMLIVPFDPNLDAGKMVSIAADTIDGEQSMRHSGNFLIEDCRHVYDAAKKSGFTQIIIGRRGIDNISSNYINREKLI